MTIIYFVRFIFKVLYHTLKNITSIFSINLTCLKAAELGFAKKISQIKAPLSYEIASHKKERVFIY